MAKKDNSKKMPKALSWTFLISYQCSATHNNKNHIARMYVFFACYIFIIMFGKNFAKNIHIWLYKSSSAGKQPGSKVVLNIFPKPFD